MVGVRRHRHFTFLAGFFPGGLPRMGPHRLRPSPQRLRIRFIEIQSSRTLSLPGETRDIENGTSMPAGLEFRAAEKGTPMRIRCDLAACRNPAAGYRQPGSSATRIKCYDGGHCMEAPNGDNGNSAISRLQHRADAAMVAMVRRHLPELVRISPF